MLIVFPKRFRSWDQRDVFPVLSVCPVMNCPLLFPISQLANRRKQINLHLFQEAVLWMEMTHSERLLFCVSMSQRASEDAAGDMAASDLRGECLYQETLDLRKIIAADIHS